MLEKGSSPHPPRQMRFKLLILWILHQQPLHGYGILKKLEALSPASRKPTSGVIYTTLRRMEEHSVLTSEWEEKKGKKDRRIYHVTDKGEKLLKRGLLWLKKRIHVVQEMIKYYDRVFGEDANAESLSWED
ncbi:MAG: PadR family transcriptional regulator [Candidatus Korarchaeota archaeon]|nr:PadR family transcriptional regulator [Candidatus Korarchaeota archaeon]NIU82057.1 hypothetical protein [Candidatus Thorarchaeota archaeon]NIW12475.1 hypothetical protein [Candidatus Thorarchaeota archaeon]NIW50690.1 hypothetical protein [Candidatus Korarchaeota archaeon]